MSYETLRYAVEDHILTLTLNRPDKLNALTDRLSVRVRMWSSTA